MKITIILHGLNQLTYVNESIIIHIENRQYLDQMSRRYFSGSSWLYPCNPISELFSSKV